MCGLGLDSQTAPPLGVVNTNCLTIVDGTIWCDDKGTGEYTDVGLQAEAELLEELRQQPWQQVVKSRYAQTLPWLYQIITNTNRAKPLEVLDLPHGGRFLDIGSGWGQLAIPLARRGQTHVLDQTLGRLRILREIARQESVTVTLHCGNIFTYPFQCSYFHAAFLNGVLEYLVREEADAYNSQLKALQHIRTLLLPGGLLYVGIENAIGLKYLLGAPDDHTGCFGSSFLNEQPGAATAKTWALDQYFHMFHDAGYTVGRAYACFPDYKLLQSLVPVDEVDRFLQEVGLPVEEHSGVDGAPLAFNESLRSLYPTLARLGIARYFVPSFGFVLTNTPRSANARYQDDCTRKCIVQAIQEAGLVSDSDLSDVRIDPVSKDTEYAHGLETARYEVLVSGRTVASVKTVPDREPFDVDAIQAVYQEYARAHNFRPVRLIRAQHDRERVLFVEEQVTSFHSLDELVANGMLSAEEATARMVAIVDDIWQLGEPLDPVLLQRELEELRCTFLEVFENSAAGTALYQAFCEMMREHSEYLRTVLSTQDFVGRNIAITLDSTCILLDYDLSRRTTLFALGVARNRVHVPYCSEGIFHAKVFAGLDRTLVEFATIAAECRLQLSVHPPDMHSRIRAQYRRLIAELLAPEQTREVREQLAQQVELERQLAQFGERTVNLQQEFEHVRSDRASIQAERDLALSARVAMEAELTGEREQRSRLETELEMARAHQAELEVRLNRIPALEADLQQALQRQAGIEAQMAGKDTHIRDIEAQLAEKDTQIQDSEATLATIYGSKAWRALSVWRKIKYRYLLSAVGLRRHPSQLPGAPENEQTPPLLSDPRPEVRCETQLEGDAYQRWCERHDPPADPDHARRQIEVMTWQPTISIVMPTYNPAADHLRAAIESVLHQYYDNWELCIVDDASTAPQVRMILEQFVAKDHRIRLEFLEHNRGIGHASNVALAHATGEYVAFLDHDDTLSDIALLEVVKLLNEYPDTDMVYSDEDKLDENDRRCNPFFKPDWSPATFLSYMYTCHLGVYRKSLIDEIGGFREGFDGSQDYDLVLRLTEQTTRIRHIPKVLYHWRMTPQSTAQSASNKSYAEEAACRALGDAIQRRRLDVREITVGRLPTTYRIRYRIPAGLNVHIIIPTRDNVGSLERCIRSLVQKTECHDYFVHIIDNGSKDRATLAYLERVQEDPRIRVLRYDRPFNYSAINNWAVSQIDGRYLLLLNDDTQVIAPGWLDAMLEHAHHSEVGAVGAKLLYPDGRIQHGGVILGIGGVAGHAHKYFPAGHTGYFNRLEVVQNLSAVTAACLMVRRDVFENVGGLNETDLAVAFNDVDFCLRVREAGYQIIYTPFAELYHHESASRGFHVNDSEVAYMQNKWHEHLQRDPFYNPNLTLDREDFSLTGDRRLLPQAS